MKKEVKKQINLLIIISVIILLGLMIMLVSNFTGRVTEKQKKQVRLYFYDEISNCSLNGYVFIGEKAIGKSFNGFFNLTYENYLENFQNNENISIFGELGSCFDTPQLFFDKSWIVPEIKKYHFPGENTFNFKAEINPNNPSKRELQGFIQPEKINSELENINLGKINILNDLSKINEYLNNKINYIKDWDFDKKINYWQIPVETLDLKQGDCEDYSTTLLSLFSSYDSSLNCYNIVFNSHVTTFCHIDDYYIYYDQEKTELKKQINKINPASTNFQLTKLKQDYFEYYGLNESETKPYYAFNDLEFIEFKNEDDFINWQYNLKDKKQEFDLFSNIEEQIIINIQDLTESWEQEELKTQTISLPNSKVYPFLIIGLFILIIILIVILIRFNKR